MMGESFITTCTGCWVAPGPPPNGFPIGEPGLFPAAAPVGKLISDRQSFRSGTTK